MTTHPARTMQPHIAVNTERSKIMSQMAEELLGLIGTKSATIHFQSPNCNRNAKNRRPCPSKAIICGASASN